jgi:predicted DNA-binding transcriptional regulator AlpA
MNTQPHLLSKLDVMTLVRASDRAIERLVKAGSFPHPIRLGKGAYWEEQVVLSWLNAKLEAQRAWKPKQRRRLATASELTTSNQQTRAN